MAERLKSYWSWVITKGCGIATNCRDDVLRQHQPGLGYIRQDDSSPDAMSGVTLTRLSTNRDIGVFKIVANGQTYDGPIETVNFA
ncbi:MAG: hypothetical protein V4646_12355 [Pseudomonadota bacterium]